MPMRFLNLKMHKKKDKSEKSNIQIERDGVVSSFCLCSLLFLSFFSFVCLFASFLTFPWQCEQSYAASDLGLCLVLCLE